MIQKIFISLVFLVSITHAKEIYATFDVVAKQSANLAIYSGGIVQRVDVDVSDVVKKGQKLVELENSDLKAALQIAKSDVENAKIALKFAKRDYERQVRIKNIIDEAKFDKYEFAYERAKVALMKAEANYKFKKILLDKSILKAPFDGEIFEKSVEVGDAVSSMMLRTVLKIQSTTKRKLLVEFDQKYFQDVKVGDTFVYKIDGDKKQYKGVISTIYPYVAQKSRKIKAEVLADNFMVGLFGDGTIITQETE